MAGGLGGGSSSSSGQSATQFQVRILLTEGDQFRPGMSVSAVIGDAHPHQRHRRPHRQRHHAHHQIKIKNETGAAKPIPFASPVAVNSPAGGETNSARGDKKSEERNKPVDVVFVIDGEHVKTVAGEDRHQRRQFSGRSPMD